MAFEWPIWKVANENESFKMTGKWKLDDDIEALKIGVLSYPHNCISIEREFK